MARGTAALRKPRARNPPQGAEPHSPCSLPSRSSPAAQAPQLTFLQLQVVAGAEAAPGVLLIWQSVRSVADPAGGQDFPAILPVGEGCICSSRSLSLPAARCPPPTARCPLPAARCQLPTAGCHSAAAGCMAATLTATCAQHPSALRPGSASDPPLPLSRPLFDARALPSHRHPPAHHPGGLPDNAAAAAPLPAAGRQRRRAAGRADARWGQQHIPLEPRACHV
jgi:hypothetical protein